MAIYMFLIYVNFCFLTQRNSWYNYGTLHCKHVLKIYFYISINIADKKKKINGHKNKLTYSKGGEYVVF